MNGLRLAGFGLRGYIGQSFTPRAAIDFSAAFGTFVEGGIVLLGRDTRYSSPMLRAGCISGLCSTGCSVQDHGICPTPMLQHAVACTGAAGAISISGGHNASGWNAFTLIGPDGALLGPQAGEHVLGIYHSGAFSHRLWNEIGDVFPPSISWEPFWDSISSFLHVEAIRARNFTVLVDPVGGAGCDFLPEFAARLGVTVLPVNGERSGYLARDPEPRPRTARHLASMVSHLHADAGFVFSSDLGRMSIVTETGEPVTEEMTFPLIARHVLARNPGTVVTNGHTTRTLDDIARSFGLPVVKTEAGQSSIVSTVMDETAVIGGEGNGSVVLPAFSLAYDGLLMMGVVLEAMALRECRVSDLLAELPRYHIVKKQAPLRGLSPRAAMDALSNRLRGMQEDGVLDERDGVRLELADGWVNVRVSRTEQAVRIISEDVNRLTAEHRAEELSHALEMIS